MADPLKLTSELVAILLSESVGRFFPDPDSAQYVGFLKGFDYSVSL
jgi:hypothetical protein